MRNAKNKVFAIVILCLIAVSIFEGAVRFRALAARHRLRSNSLEVARQVQERSGFLEESPASAMGVRRLEVGSPERIALFKVRLAYVSIDFSRGESSELFENLLTVENGLAALDPIVRHTSEDFARHILTRWVTERSPGSWHKTSEIDDFFKVYKSTKSDSLRKFLHVFKNSPESQYLAQI